MINLLIQGLLATALSGATAKAVKFCSSAAPHVAYDESVTWSGTLVETTKVQPPDISTETGKSGHALTLKLDAPVSVIAEGTALDSECDQREFQLILSPDAKARAKELKGSRVRVVAVIGHAFDADQVTPIILTVKSLDPDGTKPKP